MPVLVETYEKDASHLIDEVKPDQTLPTNLTEVQKPTAELDNDASSEPVYLKYVNPKWHEKTEIVQKKFLDLWE